MKLNSPLLAKLAILLSLVIATTSALYAQKSRTAILTLQQNITKLEGTARELKTSQAVTAKLLTHQAKAPPLETAVPALLVRIMQLRLETGVTVSAVTPTKQSVTAGAASFEQMADKLEGTGVSSVRLNVRGNYESYDGFLQYVQKLRELSVSVVYLKIDARQFELGLRAYGI